MNDESGFRLVEESSVTKRIPLRIVTNHFLPTEQNNKITQNDNPSAQNVTMKNQRKGFEDNQEEKENYSCKIIAYLLFS